MSDLKVIKKRLREENLVEELLENMGCEHVKTEQRGFLVVAQLPEHYNSTNNRSVQIKMNEDLSCSIRSRPEFGGGDIYSLVSFLVFDKSREEFQKNLPQAKEYICNMFGWKEFLSGKFQFEERKDYTSCLKNILRKEGVKRQIRPNPPLDESILNEFYVRGNPIPYQKWIDEGISYDTQMMYGVGFCLESHRVIIPMRNRYGMLVGVKGRIMKDEDDDRKYLYLYKYNNSQEIFNYHYAKPYVQSEKRVYIFEAEKSCMQLFSSGVYNTLAIGSSDITDVQADLIKQLGLDVEIVLCYDKGISTKDVKKQAQWFKNRKVFGMFDMDNLLDNKMSPIDKGIDVWNKLVNGNIYPINV